MINAKDPFWTVARAVVEAVGIATIVYYTGWAIVTWLFWTPCTRVEAWTFGIVAWIVAVGLFFFCAAICKEVDHE